MTMKYGIKIFNMLYLNIYYINALLIPNEYQRTTQVQYTR